MYIKALYLIDVKVMLQIFKIYLLEAFTIKYTGISLTLYDLNFQLG